MPSEDKRVTLTLWFAEAQPIAVLDLSAFLFDINRLYAVAFKVEQDPYELDEASYGGYGRNSFRVPKAYQLRIPRIRFASPGLLILGTVFAGIGAVWTTLQIVEKVKLWPLQEEKLRLEIAKLRRDAGEFPLPGAGILPSYRATKSERERGTHRTLRRPVERPRIEPILNLPVTKSAVNQLSSNPIKPTELAVGVESGERGYRHLDDSP